MKKHGLLVKVIIVSFFILAFCVTPQKSDADINSCVATYNSTTNTLHIPCLDLGGTSFWADLVLSQISIGGYGVNAATATAQDFVGSWSGDLVSEKGEQTFILSLA